MLRIEGLSVSYGDLRALVDIDIHVHAGTFVAVVGANGAGKSTLFKAISGTVPIQSGHVFFNGQDLSQLRTASERALLGIAHVPEGRQVFGSLSVRENLENNSQFLFYLDA